MKPRLLVVDDEPMVHEAIVREASGLFAVASASSGEEGLAALLEHGPFAVVLADYRMPGMDGVSFLARARQESPDTVRVILTSPGDMEAAIGAINEGHVFRFVTRPCPAAALRRVLLAAVAQHRLMTAERDVLEQTLAGLVKVLTEVLGLVSPDAFGRASRVRACVQHLVRRCGLADAWQYDVAAMLSQIGYITLPADTLAKVLGGQLLTRAERELVGSVPKVAGSLLGHIPRLGAVSRIVAASAESLGEPPGTAEALKRLGADLAGAWLLRVALALDDRVMRGASPREAVVELRRPAHGLPGFLLDGLEEFVFQIAASRLDTVTVSQLHTLMVLEEDVRTKTGLLLVPRGLPVTVAVIQRLRGFARGQGVREPIRVRVPDPGALSAHPEPLEVGPLPEDG